MLPTKIAVIGAGSAIFGLNTLAALMRSEVLKGSHLALVDRDAETLGLVARLAERLNREWDAGMTVTAHTDHREALPGAAFVVLSIEVPPREELWRSDWEIPLRHGVRQPYAENGGPGGFAHAARNIGPVMDHRPRHGAGLSRRLAHQLHQPHDAHLRRRGPLQPDQGGGAVPPDRRGLCHGGPGAGRRAGHHRPAGLHRHPRRPGLHAAAPQGGRPGARSRWTSRRPG